LFNRAAIYADPSGEADRIADAIDQMVAELQPVPAHHVAA
jgi:hypothetical protein